ncbi:GntR family transcriptional regulator [Solicola sp. PLA-1-18]|uniref:GntR family transcriptional regulator n=1 Tax=Solicola sp. PLA-1-18 TaxID=3380532 RepID=UPI003B78555C
MYESLALEHSSTVDRAAEVLRQALFAGDLAPGTPLREIALADQLGVGRSSVREALGVLIAEGLVTRIPNRGVVVTELDPEQIHDVVAVRLVLETAGAHAWIGATDEARGAVRSAMADYRHLAQVGAEARQITEAHLAFHRSLVALTGSRRLVAVADQVTAEIRLALAHLDRLRLNAAEQVTDHQRLLDMLEDGDTEGVATELVAHLADAESSLVETLYVPEG